MELGPIQKAWIASLREHPERQLKGSLGIKLPDGKHQACCLGEGGLIAKVCEWKGDRLYSKLTAGVPISSTVLGEDTYKALGLFGSTGRKYATTSPGEDVVGLSLASLNDQGTTWPEIADILEKNPEDWFERSV